MRNGIVCFVLLFMGQIEASFNGYRLPKNYNKHDLPNNTISGIPLYVQTRIIIYHIRRIDEIKHELEMDVLVLRKWKDERVEFTEPIQKGRLYAVDLGKGNRFWMPELFIAGMLDFSTKHGHMDLKFLMLSYEKNVLVGLRATLLMSCTFYFDLYPLDVQKCNLDISAFLRTADEVVITWWKGNNTAHFDHRGNYTTVINLPTFKVSIATCSKTTFIKRSWGNVTMVRAYLTMERMLKSHLMEVYIPTTLFVMISWGSFLVKPEMVPGRMVLLVTNLLSLITMFEAHRSSSPPALGIKCLDVWHLSCILFVFLALLEYATVLYKMLRPTPFRKLNLFTPASFPNWVAVHSKDYYFLLFKKMVSRLDPKTCRNSPCCFCCPGSASQMSWCAIDRLSFFYFPIMFLIYTIAYWSIFLHQRNLVLTDTHQCLEIDD